MQKKKFKQINSAYNQLTNPDNQLNSGSVFSSFDFLESLFGNMFQEKVDHVPPIHVSLKLSLEEIFKGCNKTISITKKVCNPRHGKRQCHICKGAGNIKIREQINPMMMAQRIEHCKNCKGVGIIGELIEVTQTLHINIPVTIQNKETIILYHRGNEMLQGEIGDVHVKIIITPHAVFVCDKQNLKIKKNISLKESLIGFEHEISTISGKKLLLQISTITTHNSVKIIKHEGMFINDHTRGDLQIRYKVVYPNKLSIEQKKIIEKNVIISR